SVIGALRRGEPVPPAGRQHLALCPRSHASAQLVCKIWKASGRATERASRTLAVDHRMGNADGTADWDHCIDDPLNSRRKNILFQNWGMRCCVFVSMFNPPAHVF